MNSSISSAVLILGGRGRFGRAAAHAFATAGWQVFAQVRPGAVPPDIDGVQWISAEPGDTQSLFEQARNASVVVQALSPVYTHKAWKKEVPALTQAAIDITRKLGATLMLPASVYNFGKTMPDQLHEDTPQRAETFKGRMRMASEAMVRQATQDRRMKAVVIRGGDFFGSGTGSWFDLLIAKGLQQGKVTYPGALDVRTTWAYLPDMARCFVQVAAVRDKLAGFEEMHFAGYALTGKDWVDALSDIAWERGWLPPSRQLRVKRLSWPLLRMLALFMPSMASMCEMRYLWSTPYTLVNRRMRALVGDERQTPFAEALRTSLDELGLTASQTALAISRQPSMAAQHARLESPNLRSAS